jgi:hypothetical protein
VDVGLPPGSPDGPCGRSVVLFPVLSVNALALHYEGLGTVMTWYHVKPGSDAAVNTKAEPLESLAVWSSVPGYLVAP